MKTIQTMIDEVERFAPPSLAEFDYVGLLHGDRNHPVKKVGITLDYTLHAIQRAVELGCEMLITHHGPTEISYPLFGNNLSKIALAEKASLAVYRCHLNLDFCDGGIIDTLCTLLEIPAKKQRTFYHGKEIYGGVNLSTEVHLSYEELLHHLKNVNSESIRIAGTKRKTFQRIAITSGQGFIGEFFDQLQPDVYIAGEFEQEAVKYAEDLGIFLIELGHFQSEQSTLPLIAKKLQKVLGVETVSIEVPNTIRDLSSEETLC